MYKVADLTKMETGFYSAPDFRSANGLRTFSERLQRLANPFVIGNV